MTLRREDTLVMHQGGLSWLDRTLAERFDGPTVVVTHHGPHLRCAHPHFSGDPLNVQRCNVAYRQTPTCAMDLGPHPRKPQISRRRNLAD
jgi:hypothetical protein